MRTKRIIALAVALMLLCISSVSAFAQPMPRWVNANRAEATISITGTSARCITRIAGNPGTTSIEGDMVLEDENGNIVKSWTFSSSGTSINMTKTATVKKGVSYTLYVDAVVECNGVSESIYTSDSATA